MYSYLSKILHKADVGDWLLSKKYKEKDIYKVLKNKFKIKLEPFNTNKYNGIDTSEFTLIEKMYLLREADISNKLRDELSSHIHFNLQYSVGLDPYVFRFCSKYVHDEIERNITQIYNM